MKQAWSSWLGRDLDTMDLNSDSLSDVATRMDMLRHLSASVKVLDEVNQAMKDMTHEDINLHLAHPDVKCEGATATAIDNLVKDMTSMSDVGTWPQAWAGNDLRTMAIVTIGYTTCLKTDYKSMLTLMVKVYHNTFGEEALLQQAEKLQPFTLQLVSGVAMALNLTPAEIDLWKKEFDLTSVKAPVDLIKSLYDIRRNTPATSPVLG